MRYCITSLFVLFSFAAHAGGDSTTAAAMLPPHHNYERGTTLAMLGVGFIDGYKQEYTVPAGFAKNTATGFVPIYGRIEYAFDRHFSIAANFTYDAFTYNYDQLYTGNSGNFYRYRSDDVRIYSGGIVAFYHLGSLLHVRNLDPYIGAGLSLNNIHHTALAQGDSTASVTDHVVNPYLKVGARYYISARNAVYAEAGYDKQSIFSVGFSARFFPRK